MELAVGMLLTTVTAAAGFSMYLYFIKTIKKHNEDEKLVKSLQAYYFYLDNDWKNAEKIMTYENGIILLNNNDIIRYHLKDTLLIREIEDKSIDTFYLHTSELEIPEEKISNGNVAEISVNQYMNRKEIKWKWKKEYSPVESINQYILNDVH